MVAAMVYFLTWTLFKSICVIIMNLAVHLFYMTLCYIIPRELSNGEQMVISMSEGWTEGEDIA